MSSRSDNMYCFCDVRKAALSVAIYKVLFTTFCLILSAIAAHMYQEVPEDYSERDVRITRVIGGALIALAIFCVLLLMLNVMLLWAVIKERSQPIKWWIRLMVVVEVLICSSMFMAKWNTILGLCLLLNFALNIFLLRAVCAYRRALVSDIKGSKLKNSELDGEQLTQERYSSSHSLHGSESSRPATLLEETTEKTPEDV